MEVKVGLVLSCVSASDITDIESLLSRILCFRLYPVYTCPFCSKHLVLTKSCCKKYQTALSNLQATYEKKDLFVQETMLADAEVTREDLSYSIAGNLTDVPKLEPLSFPFRELCHWQIGGRIENEVLHFYLRDADQVVYHCQMKCSGILEQLTALKTIEICNSDQHTVIDRCAPEGVLGNYHFEHDVTVLDRMSYKDFLQRLLKTPQ